MKAWIKRLSGNQFLLWDPSGEIKVKLNCISEEILSLPCGSLVYIEGLIEDESICVLKAKPLHVPIDQSLACIDKSNVDPVEYTLRYHLLIRQPGHLRRVILYSVIVDELRSLLKRRGFIELPPPILGPSSDPGLRGASKVPVKLYGKAFELQSSLIMYKQLYASMLDKIFYVARNIREEPVENAFTGRHLVEFTQLDIEEADSNRESMIKLAEIILYKTIKHLLDRHSELLEYRDIERIEREITKPPYPRLSYDDALDLAIRDGLYTKPGAELNFDVEVALSKKYGTPLWIISYPSESRGFYYIEDPNKPGYNVDYNLLLPGHGEVIDGGCREYVYDRLVDKITRRHCEPLEKYSWFLELAKAGLIRPSCGWGLGIERLLKYILNLDHIVYASPHPRLPGFIGP